MLRDDNSFRHKLNEIHTKVVKDDDAEVETGIWDNGSDGVMEENFSSERHDIIFDSLRKRMARRFKTNIVNSFILYMKSTHGLSVGKYIDEKESERYKDIATGVEALIWVGKYSL